MRAWFGRLVLLLIALMVVYNVAQEVMFQRARTPRDIRDGIDLENLKSNEYVRVDLPLDMEKAVAVQYLSKKELYFIPFVNTNCELLYALEGPLDKDSITQFLPPFTGRLAGRNLVGKWEVYDRDVKVQEIFKRQQNLTVPRKALVLYSAERGAVGLWRYLIGGVGILYILFFFRGLFRGAPGIRSPDENAPRPGNAAGP